MGARCAGHLVRSLSGAEPSVTLLEAAAGRQASHGRKLGDPTGLPAGAAVSADGKAVVDVGNDNFVFVQFVSVDSHQKFLDSGVSDDARVLPLRFSPGSELRRTWTSVADDWSSEPFEDWPSVTFGAVVPHLREEGRGNPGVASRAVGGLGQGRGLLVGHVGAQGIVSVPPAHGLVRPARRHQPVVCGGDVQAHPDHRLLLLEKIRDLEAKSATGVRLMLDEVALVGGMSRTDSTLMIAPGLMDHARAEAEKQASLAKNLRKAREEREVARKK